MPPSPDPDLPAAKRHLQSAIRALGDRDPATRLIRSALGNIERRLAGAPAERAAPLELRRGSNGRWQVWSGARVMKAWPARTPYREALVSASVYAVGRQRDLRDCTTAADRISSSLKENP